MAEFYEFSDVLCPHAPRFLGEKQAYRDFYVAQREAGQQLWFYSCSGPSKLLDPAAYYRSQFWVNLSYGGKGSCYWAFGDEGGFSWNAYSQPHTVYSPLFLSPTTVTDAKQMEAIREGAEDYEYFMMLQAKVDELEAAGISGQLLDEAKTVLTTAPNRALDAMGPNRQNWMVPRPCGHGSPEAAGARHARATEQAVAGARRDSRRSIHGGVVVTFACANPRAGHAGTRGGIARPLRVGHTGVERGLCLRRQSSVVQCSVVSAHRREGVV